MLYRVNTEPLFHERDSFELSSYLTLSTKGPFSRCSPCPPVCNKDSIPESMENIEKRVPLQTVSDKMIARQPLLNTTAQQSQSRHDPSFTDFSVNSYVLYTPPADGVDKHELKHKGPYELISKLGSVYTIHDEKVNYAYH